MDGLAPVVGLADGVTIAEALRPDQVTGKGAAKPAGSDTTDTDTDTTTASQARPSAGPAKVSRAPRGGGRWRRRSSEPAEESRRRPADKNRPTTTTTATATTPTSAPSEETAPSWGRRLPLVGRKDPATTTPDGSTAGKAVDSATATKSRRKLLSRKVRAGQAPADQKKAESRRAARKQAKKKTPATSVERRRRIPVALAGVFALAVLATNFPLSSILGQHAQLSSASAQLQRVRQQNKALTAQEDALKSNVAINELARGDLQMVTPGQTLYDVLPPSNNTDNTTPGSPTFGDPGDQPLVAPDNAPDLSPQQVLPTPIPATADGSTATVSTKSAKATVVSNSPARPSRRSSYWSRVADTLEFWR